MVHVYQESLSRNTCFDHPPYYQLLQFVPLLSRGVDPIYDCSKNDNNEDVTRAVK